MTKEKKIVTKKELKRNYQLTKNDPQLLFLGRQLSIIIFIVSLETLRSTSKISILTSIPLMEIELSPLKTHSI